MSVVKINAITVPADSGDELARRFAARAGAVDGQAGFEGFELLKPTDEPHDVAGRDPLADEESFQAWLSSPSFGHGHRSAAERGGGEAPKPVWRAQRAVVVRGRGRFARPGELSGARPVSADPWADGTYLRAVQYKTDANLAARQSVYAFQHPPVDLPARVLDLAAPAESDTVADIGCGNGRYLAEFARRGFPGRIVGADLSLGMLQAARGGLNAAAASRAAFAAGAVAAASLAAAASAARSPLLASVALISADAAALPLRDGVADVTLASHMLYHVPEPAVALSELRRVTRPGGRVIIVLNGAAHLRQLRAALADARGQDPATLAERFTLDDGESLARSFFPESPGTTSPQNSASQTPPR